MLHPYKCQYCIPLNKCFLFLFFGCFPSHSISFGFAVFMFDAVCLCVCVWVGVIFFIHSVFIHNPECVFIFLFLSTISLTMYICVARLCRSISMEWLYRFTICHLDSIYIIFGPCLCVSVCAPSENFSQLGSGSIYFTCDSVYAFGVCLLIIGWIWM